MDSLTAENNQAETMLRLQDEINSKINKAWRDENNPWYRAIWTECAELMDHIGWKWWKSQDSDIHQMKLELVDIWHFGLSEILAKTENLSEATKIVTPSIIALGVGNRGSSKAELLHAIESFTTATLSKKSFDIGSYVDLAKLSGLGADELYKSYVGKNVLNSFRQDNGYKSGTYIKIWKDKEDNVWLSEIIESLPIDSPTFATDLYSKLECAYKSII